LTLRGGIHIFTVMTARPTPDAAGSLASAGGTRRELSPAAQRALAEAEARRASIDRKSADQPKELNGRGGPDPVRYGDWEVRGIASDF
jgi:hypothetical protein